VKLVSWNVNGLRAAWKKGFAEFASAEGSDVLCLQETKIQPDQLTDEMKSLLDYRAHWSFAEKKGYSGVVTYSRPAPLAVATAGGTPALNAEGRIVHTEFPDFHLFNVYFPNGGMGPERLAHKLTFYDDFLALCERLRRGGKGIVVCGDVNTAHTEIDLARPKENAKTSGFMPEEREALGALYAAGLVDSFRHLYPDAVKYSWWDMVSRARDRNVGVAEQLQNFERGGQAGGPLDHPRYLVRPSHHSFPRVPRRTQHTGA